MSWAKNSVGRLRDPKPATSRRIRVSAASGRARFFGRGRSSGVRFSAGWVLFAVPALVFAQDDRAPDRPPDRVRGEVRATVSASLDSVRFKADYLWTPARRRAEVIIARVADRAARIPEVIPPAAEPQLFPSGYDGGGFMGLRVSIDGRPCRRELRSATGRPDPPPDLRPAPQPDMGLPVTVCQGRFEAGQTVRVAVHGTLRVPERYGPFGVHRRQMTLLGGWFPVLGRPGEAPPDTALDLSVDIPPGHAAVLGAHYFPYVPRRPDRGRRLQVTRRSASVPLVVLPARTGTRSARGGAMRWVSGRRYTDDPTALRQAELTVSMLDDAVSLLSDEGLPVPSPTAPLLVVEAPLRRYLAYAGDGVVLVSDRAYRLPPFERFQRFHQFPVLREIFASWALDHVRQGPERRVMADAVGGYLRDLAVLRTSGYAEDLFDVLSFWSFVPAVDALLYAPQTAFIGAYFKIADESDPLRVELIDPLATAPRGRIVYAKLVDRVGLERAGAAMRRLLQGATLLEALDGALGPGEVDAFLSTWLGPYPKLQYGLQSWGSRPVVGPQCAPADRCYEARVEVFRTGTPAPEPVQLRLTDDAGETRLVWSETSTRSLRTVSATLAAELDLVELDPRGRVTETPTVEMPSPKFDNRSRARWRVLLNSFNFGLSPTAGTFDTSLSLGVSKVRDVFWRYGVSAGYGPDAISVAARTARRFGARVTPDRLGQWVGVSLAGALLRSEFAGEADDRYALTARLFYGYDDRQTVWAPEPGLGIRASLTYNHVFSEPASAPADGPAVTRDAVAISLRALRSWRIDGRHQLSLRGSVGAIVFGRPQSQLLFFLGGREAVRGYAIDAEGGRYRAIASAEWVHPLLSDLDENFLEAVWVSRLDGALYADVAAIGDDPTEDLRRSIRADVGYGVRIYLDYFGVRPGVMAVDIAVPLFDGDGRFALGSPEVYVAFSQSFLSF